MSLAALALACSSSSESTLADQHQQRSDEVAQAGPNGPDRPSEPAQPDARDPGLDASTPGAAVGPVEPELTGEAPKLPEAPESPPAADAAASIQPSGPAPGTPEADAELAELLDESTLTQEEFDSAFRGGGPKIEGDQFMFGPNERPRGRPLVDIGAPTVTGSSVAPSKLADMAQASQRDLVGCYALALGKAPKLAGAVTLKLRFDAGGKVSAATIEGSSPLGAALDRCLVSVADAWSLAAAAGASVRVPLKLSITTGD
ncbi:hypothetical protein [Enhygromyxa salina]|uniref:AgmX/PglI C-terminal domain-containing protein n=1 Tax=Enhygromyxa salina TaxID=215803 RepID=A0A2S9Y816_9BACT|nr:hypothetical protein [Enhygromyxa salina]PRQ01161.1 hypothetical protein ENSA7_57660 [Enhygromyxa salina]